MLLAAPRAPAPAKRGQAGNMKLYLSPWMFSMFNTSSKIMANIQAAHQVPTTMFHNNLDPPRHRKFRCLPLYDLLLKTTQLVFCVSKIATPDHPQPLLFNCHSHRQKRHFETCGATPTKPIMMTTTHPCRQELRGSQTAMKTFRPSIPTRMTQARTRCTNCTLAKRAPQTGPIPCSRLPIC